MAPLHGKAAVVTGASRGMRKADGLLETISRRVAALPCEPNVMMTNRQSCRLHEA